LFPKSPSRRKKGSPCMSDISRVTKRRSHGLLDRAADEAPAKRPASPSENFRQVPDPRRWTFDMPTEAIGSCQLCYRLFVETDGLNVRRCGIWLSIDPSPSWQKAFFSPRGPIFCWNVSRTLESVLEMSPVTLQDGGERLGSTTS
jgi:hypothetical protein